jgi:hypothetical protein
MDGTSTRVFAGAPYASGGKTGTAQAVGIRQNEKYNAAKLAEHQRDHSLYMAMAPVEAPTRGAGGGGGERRLRRRGRRPIARRVFDYLLLGQCPARKTWRATVRRGPCGRAGAARRRRRRATCRCQGAAPARRPQRGRRAMNAGRSSGPRCGSVCGRPCQPALTGRWRWPSLLLAGIGLVVHVLGRLRPRHALRATTAATC